KRMRSRLPKVLHRIGGRPLVSHVLASVREAGVTAIAVVVGPGHEDVAAEVKRQTPAAEVFVQADRRGTAHATLCARSALARGFGAILIAFGDTPLLRPQTFEALRDAVGGDVGVAVLGFRPADPTGYGRLIVENGTLTAIREHKDASAAEREIGLCNAGLMALSGPVALAILDAIGCDNAQGEFYLTDAVAVAAARGLKSVVLEAEEDEVRGINTRAQLAEAEAVLQHRLRAAAMENGATLIAPETVHLSPDTVLGPDVIVEPYCVFGPGVVVEEGAVIHAFSHLEGAHVGRAASIGPYARLRPGSRIGVKARIGNFVETKAAQIDDGAKANHLAYIGDAHVGAGANVGAGTITCNYDGANKHRTEIGAGAFIGSNSALVAPVAIGEGAYVGSGSVITKDVPGGALAVGRGRQVVKEGWAGRARAAAQTVRKEPASSE
ncbi:MAG: bifunctional UDP-N-acetylglucosamine diphosphorylase/glucosamine-1-phosphate N-acetyltransferase GlmU, partial [Rhizobiales bacterium]|nr:bifunctional UDP-N-acetylglucosamine diphosphorylase/glucosamine-1-phosphate N-acetyltransferase GlmU [Hyphomicrobiales bacterium]